MRLATLAIAAALGAPVASRSAEPASEPRPPAAPSGYTMEQARSAVDEHIRKTAGSGTYPLVDDRTGETLALELVQVAILSAGSLWKTHDPDRHVEASSYVACIRFHPVGTPRGKEFDVDMLVEPREAGLEVTDVRIHREKQLVRGEWVWQPRAAAPPRP